MSERHASKILVIEDETTQRILAKEYLESAGYVVRLAEDGKRGLVMAGLLKPDLIILDLLLPSIDGYTLCKRLKQHPTTSKIPIILVTASRAENVIERGLAAGASDFITKPVDWEYLADRVANVMQKANDINKLIAEKEAREEELRTLLDERQIASLGQSLPTNQTHPRDGDAAPIKVCEFEDRLDAVRRDAGEQVRNAIAVAQENALAERELYQAEMERAAKNMEIISQSFWSVIAATSEPQIAMLTSLDQITSPDASGESVPTPFSNSVTAQQDNTVQSLLSSTRNMNALAQHMSGQVHLEEAPFDLTALIRDAIAYVRPNSEQLKLGVESDLPKEPIYVVADRERVRYALLSIVMNAFKFSPTGGTVRILLNAEPGQPVQLHVEDHGSGMTPEQAEVLQNSALLPASALFQPNGNMGFGIPMAVAIMRLHQGTLSVSSSVGSGTTVTLSFPEARRNEHMNIDTVDTPLAVSAA